MNKQFTAREVCSVEKRFRYATGGSRIADMLHAYADRLEADEKMVPVYQHRNKNGPMLRWFDCSEETFMAMEHNEHDREHFDRRILYTHPAPSDAERLEELGRILRGAMIQGDARVIGKNELKHALEILAAYSAQVQPPAASVTDIDTMVNRFLSWRLPQDFAPDAGISFKPMPDEYMPHCWPTGTNLFHAGQVKEMILHMLAAQENPNG